MDKELKYKEAVSINLIRLRENKGLNQGELAKAIGVSQNTLSEIERMKRPLSDSVLDKLSKYFKVVETDITSDPELIEMKNKLKSLK